MWIAFREGGENSQIGRNLPEYGRPSVEHKSLKSRHTRQKPAFHPSRSNLKKRSTHFSGL
jgi:hypothetical protein